MFEVSENSVMPDPLPIEIEKGNRRTCQWHRDVSRWSGEPWEKAEQIRKKNEETDTPNEVNVGARVSSGTLVKNILDSQAHGIGDEQFRDLLHCSGLIDGKARPKNHGQYCY